ncbi:uncharacterized protein LOC135193519 [Vanessa tameamea]|uniref:Uncharacterized protein LOC135193519 n=1 Tax=Vanessa tameamea TaxID=334116 RepID=A0ABM4AM79_VANTA
MALYGAPVWSHRLTCAHRCKTKILSLQRRVAIRMVRGYRTISFEAATLLACFPPLDILAERDARIYDRTRALRQSGESASYPASAFGALRWQETWCARLRGDRYAHKRVVSAILPAFEAWMRRKRRVTFRLTQVLTGHGCFGEYLCKIGREAMAVCHHCEADQDTAQHTLEACPAWTVERQVLV